MKSLTPLLAISFLIGCDGEKSNEAKHPNLKYEVQGDAVTITGCDRKASGELIIPSVIEGNPVTTIGVNAFWGCTSLTSITIPDSVNSIGKLAFAYCRSLTSITIPDGVTSIGKNAFLECTSLMTIEVSMGNMNYTDVEGVLFNRGKTLLNIYPADKAGANYVIPDSVTSIGESAFWKCTGLTSITIPDSVTSIGDEAFYKCRELRSITIGNDITSVGGVAFGACTSLSTVTFLGDAPKIENNAFTKSSPTIYRKADAKGWSDTLAGRPVKLISEKP